MRSLRRLASIALIVTLAGCSSARSIIDDHTTCPLIIHNMVGWLADGDTLIFTKQSPYQADLYRIRRDGTGEQLIASSVEIPSLSPDTTRVYFYQYQTTASMPVTNQSVILDLATSQRISGPDPLRSGIWLPDSSGIFFPDRPTGANAYYEFSLDTRQSTLWSGSPVDPRMLTVPAWAPDGSHVAFAYEADTAIIRLSDWSVEYVRNLGFSSCGNSYVLPVAWSPDSRALLIKQHCANNTIAMGVVDQAGVKLNDWKRQFSDVSSAQWSPDGRRIAYTSQTFEGPRVYVVDMDGSHELLLGEGIKGQMWSPDGTQIATVKRAGTWNTDIVLIEADGSGEQSLTHAPGPDNVCLH